MGAPALARSRSGSPFTRSLAASSRDFRQRLQAREPGALERFFDLWFDAVYARAARGATDLREAEEVTEHVFERLWNSMAELDPDQDLERWVDAIVSQGVQAHERSRRRSPEGLAEAVHSLPLTARTVVSLRICDKLAFVDIARLLGLTPAAVHEHYVRGLACLRHRIQGDTDTDLERHACLRLTRSGPMAQDGARRPVAAHAVNSGAGRRRR